MIRLGDMQNLFRKNPVAVSAFVVTTVIALLFGGHFLYRVVYWTLHAQEPVRPWMTAGYIGRSWDIKPRQLDEVAGLPGPEGGKPLTLREIAKRRGVPVNNVIADVETAIRTIQSQKQNKDGRQGEGKP